LLFNRGDNPIDLRSGQGLDEAIREMKSDPRTGSKNVAARSGMLPGFSGLLRSQAVKNMRTNQKGFRQGISGLNSISRLLKGTAGAGLAGLGGLAGYGAYNTLEL